MNLTDYTKEIECLVTQKQIITRNTFDDRGYDAFGLDYNNTILPMSLLFLTGYNKASIWKADLTDEVEIYRTIDIKKYKMRGLYVHNEFEIMLRSTRNYIFDFKENEKYKFDSDWTPLNPIPNSLLGQIFYLKLQGIL